MKLVVVTWNDAYYEAGPFQLKDGVALCNSPFLNETVGFVVGESDENILVAQERGRSDSCEPYSVRHMTTIPKCCILSVKELDYGTAA